MNNTKISISFILLMLIIIYLIFYRSDRTGHAGGVAIYVMWSWNVKQPSDSTIEYILLELPNKSHGRTHLGCIYRPNRTVDYGSLLNVVSDISLEYTDIILAGHFNSNLLSESHLVDNFKSLGLFSVNETIPTHFSSHCDTLLISYQWP